MVSPLGIKLLHKEWALYNRLSIPVKEKQDVVYVRLLKPVTHRVMICFFLCILSSFHAFLQYPYSSFSMPSSIDPYIFRAYDIRWKYTTHCRCLRAKSVASLGLSYRSFICGEGKDYHPTVVVRARCPDAQSELKQPHQRAYGSRLRCAEHRPDTEPGELLQHLYAQNRRWCADNREP